DEHGRRAIAIDRWRNVRRSHQGRHDHMRLRSVSVPTRDVDAGGDGRYCSDDDRGHNSNLALHRISPRDERREPELALVSTLVNSSAFPGPRPRIVRKKDTE